MQTTQRAGATQGAEKWPRWALSRAIWRSRRWGLDDLQVRAVVLELCDRADDEGEVGRFHVGDVMSVADVSERTARRIVDRVNATGIVELYRAGRRGYRVTWRGDHPLLERARGNAAPKLRLVAAEGTAPAPNQPPPPPPPPPPPDLTAEESQAVAALEHAHATAKASRLRVPGVVGERVPAAARAELAAFVLDVARAHCAGDVAAAAAAVARAYVSLDGHDGILRARSWPLGLLRHDLARIAARVATRAKREREPEPEHLTSPPATEAVSSRGFDPAALARLQARLRGEGEKTS